MTLNDILFKQFGIQTYVKTSSVTLPAGDVVTKLVDNNPNRLMLHITNCFTNNIFVYPSANIGTTLRIMLIPNSGTLKLTWYEDFALVGVDWYGYTGVLNYVSITEVLLA